ncbi:hypothetical protein B0T13DRAFT_510753 [Neurospora crassa]|nr:hypothetical protein B0T13DRAFT_510753 [Neurospora crassa]
MARHQLRPQILTYTSLALLGMLGLTNAWWGAGAPECAQSCLSSAWSAASITSWPAPTDWCASGDSSSDIQSRKDAASSCLVSACSATPTVHSSYSSLSSSLCAQYSSCSSAGSTGVYTVSLPAFTGAWDGRHDGGGPIGGWWQGGGHGGPAGTGTGTGQWGPHYGWAGTATWTGGVYTVTGCEWDGSPWAGGPWGWGHGYGHGDYGNGQANGPWGIWGAGWTMTSTGTETVTAVQTITRDATGGDGSVTKVMELTTSTGLATVGYAVNEESKEEATTVLGVVQAAASTTGSGGSSGAASAGGAGAGMGVKVGVAVLGGVVVVVGLL